MTYELCKKLKDAGFKIPFGDKGELTCKAQMIAREQNNFISCDHQKCILELQEVYIPTLSELISACGEGFKVLDNWYENNWFAWKMYYGELNTEIAHGEGSTPEEAVANLWLSLNEKK